LSTHKEAGNFPTDRPTWRAILLESAALMACARDKGGMAAVKDASGHYRRQLLTAVDDAPS